MLLILILILLLLYIFSLKLEIKTINNEYQIPIKIGEKFENINMSISLNNYYNIFNTYLSDNSKYFISTNEEIFINFKTIDNNKFILGKFYKCYDSLFLGEDDTILNITFYQQHNDDIIYFKDIIAFSRFYYDKQFSLIFLLKENKLIKKEEFSFINLNNKRYLYLGEIPNLFKKENKIKYELNLNSFDIDKSIFGWSCNLTNIIIPDNNNIKLNIINEYVSLFDTNQTDIYIPNNYFNNFVDILIKNNKKDNCYINEGKIICEKVNKNIINDIIFVFNEKIGFKFNYKKLLDNNNILILSKNQFNNNWIFGINFLKYFNITFDYEKKVIKFFDINNKNIINIKKYYNYFIIKKYITINLIISIMGIIFLIYIKFKLFI